jgi:spermidine synthase
MPTFSIPFLYAIFFVSGAAALIYQIAWVRSLSLIFGGSHLAVTTVIAIFMGGLALGSFAAARYVHACGNRLRLYAVLELCIAIGAVIFQALLQAYPSIYTALARLAPETPLFLTTVRVFLCVVILLPITTLMGATLPVLVDFCAERPSLLGRRLSALYAINTVGAVSGVLIAGFVLLPGSSISVTVGVALALNLVAAAGAWLLSRRFEPQPAALEGRSMAPLDSPIDGLASFILLGAAVSGFCALAYEVLWTRVLVISLGATDYGFTAILAAFLVGIGAGSALYNRLKSYWQRSGEREAPLKLFALAQILIGASIAVSVARLYDLPGHYIAIRHTVEGWGLNPFNARQLANLIVALIYLGLPAVLMGVSFPLAGDLYGRYCRSAAFAVGRVASVNTLGAIAGASFAGFFMIQTLGIERSIHLVIIINVGYGLLLWLRASTRPRLSWLAPAGGLVLAVFLIAEPAALRAWDSNFFAVYRSNRPELFTSKEKIASALEKYKVLYYGEGNSSIVAATQLDELRIFSTNGRVEATTSLQDMQNQFALGHLPTLLHADPKRVLVVGGGAGMTLGATSVHPAVEQVTLAELEPKVLGVIREFADYNHDVLASRKLHVVINDGRNHLLTTNDRYDVITSDPIHPWFRGAGYLYTRQYFELAAARMNPGGVMAQWLPLYQMNTDHIRSVLASFAAAFKHTSVWLLYSDAVIIGSNSPLQLDLDRIDAIQSVSPDLASDLQRVHMGGPAENLLSYFLAGNEGVSRLIAGAKVNTDDNLYLEFDTPRAIGVLTEGPNIMMLSTARDSASPMMVSADRARMARWSSLEPDSLLSRIDRAQLGAHYKQGEHPGMRSLVFSLDNAELQLGRWKTIRAHLYPAGIQ